MNLEQRSWSRNHSTNLFHRIVLLWELFPSRSFWLSIFLYAFFSWMITQRSLLLPSKVAYFNYLADAFLYGQLKLKVIPFTTHDLILFNEGYYCIGHRSQQLS